MKAITTTLSGPFPETVKAGFKLLGEAVKANGSENAVLLVPHLQHFESTVTGEVLGGEVAKELKKNRVVTIAGDVTLSLHTPKTISYSTPADEMIAVYVSSKELKKALSKVRGVKTLIYVPWLDNERDTFVETYNATEEVVEDPRETAG